MQRAEMRRQFRAAYSVAPCQNAHRASFDTEERRYGPPVRFMPPVSVTSSRDARWRQGAAIVHSGGPFIFDAAARHGTRRTAQTFLVMSSPAKKLKERAEHLFQRKLLGDKAVPDYRAKEELIRRLTAKLRTERFGARSKWRALTEPGAPIDCEDASAGHHCKLMASAFRLGPQIRQCGPRTTGPTRKVEDTHLPQMRRVDVSSAD
jgi:hypothetical protein